jgi:1-deoxy-D-xylulose-5-phosphate synthase
MWDLALLGIVPGLRIAAPRDEPTLRESLREALEYSAGPTALRFPKTPLGDPVPALRRIGEVDVLAEPDPESAVDVLVVAIGAMARDVLEAVTAAQQAGYSVRVVSPRWVNPVEPVLVDLADRARLVVTVEDGVVVNGVGARISQTLRSAGREVPTREIGLPVRFLEHGSVAVVRAAAGLTVQDIGRRIVEWLAVGNRETVEPDGSAAGPAASEVPVVDPGSHRSAKHGTG